MESTSWRMSTTLDTACMPPHISSGMPAGGIHRGGVEFTASKRKLAEVGLTLPRWGGVEFTASKRKLAKVELNSPPQSGSSGGCGGSPRARMGTLS
eukprot:8892034-Pyramimonas_sp.AAC.1